MENKNYGDIIGRPDEAPYLNSLPDPLDDDGNVIVSQQPGLGLDLNWEYIEANRVV